MPVMWLELGFAPIFAQQPQPDLISLSRTLCSSPCHHHLALHSLVFDMPAKRVLVSYGVDIDAVAGWLGSYGGEDSPSDISRGIFAAEVGVPRMLRLFAKKGIRATWFIPGHTLESFPTECRAIVDAGHEIGLHGYSHENPTAMSLDQQKAILEKTFRQLTEFVGKSPTGSVAPWWETSAEGADLLLSYGIEYDHSMMHHDSQCYWLRTGDQWTKIDYANRPESWMKPLQRGDVTGLVEIPANWYVDDLPPMMFIKKSPNSHGWVNPRDIEQMWMDMFQWLYDNEEDFVFPVSSPTPNDEHNAHEADFLGYAIDYGPPGCVGSAPGACHARTLYRLDQHARRRPVVHHGRDEQGLSLAKPATLLKSSLPRRTGYRHSIGI